MLKMRSSMFFSKKSFLGFFGVFGIFGFGGSVSLVEGTNVIWKENDCGTPSLPAKIDKFDVQPQVPQLGHDLTVTVEGSLKTPAGAMSSSKMTGGSLELSGWDKSVHLFTISIDLCGPGSKYSLPFGAGHVTIKGDCSGLAGGKFKYQVTGEATHWIKFVFSQGHFQFVVKDQTQNELTCTNLEVDIMVKPLNPGTGSAGRARDLVLNITIHSMRCFQKSIKKKLKSPVYRVIKRVSKESQKVVKSRKRNLLLTM